MEEYFNSIDGRLIAIKKEDVECYRSTECGYKCVIYMKDGTEHKVLETFKEVDYIFDL